MDFLPWGMLTLLIGTLSVLFSNETRGQRVYGSKLGLLSVFLLHVLVTIIASKYPEEGFAALPLLLSWIAAYVLITWAVNTERRMVFFYFLFLLFCLKMSQHGFKSWVMAGFSFNKEGVSGAPGWFANSGEVGIQMCIYLPMSLYFVWAGWHSWTWPKRAFALLMPITALGTVVASSSRGAVIGSALALLWILAKSKYRTRGFIGLAVVGMLVFMMLPPEFMARFDTMGEDNSSKLRLEYWAWGWEATKAHPLLGLGYGNWIPEYSQFLIDNGINRPPQVSHNIFIQAGSELGFTGLILVLSLIVSTFVLNARTRRILPDTDTYKALRNFSHGLDAGMIGFLVSAQFVTVLYYPYLWIAVALTVALHNVAAKRALAEIGPTALVARRGMRRRVARPGAAAPRAPQNVR
jgi:O-antigen ligase